jgi:hypothetical protein
MPLVDRDEFERGKRQAAAYWRGKGDIAAAEAFEALEISACGFGIDATARLAWSGARSGLQVGLRFELHSGIYVSSFIRRTKT